MLAQFFDRQKFATTALPIKKAASECQSDTGADNEWAYRIERLRLPLAKELRAFPKGVFDAHVEVSIAVSGNCVPETEHHDPLLSLEAELVVTARCPGRDILLCAWHFDRHPPCGVEDHSADEEPDVAAPAEPCAVHPRYHMHFGGRRMTKTPHDFGATLLLPGPRLPHPPVDGVLFIDFVLSNFVEQKWRHARGNAQYLRLVRSAQERLWKPYARSVGLAWNRAPSLEWPVADVWPHVC